MKKLFVLLVLATMLTGCGDSSDDHSASTNATQCNEPENPYSEDTGHYAGFEWAEENGPYCNGDSESFNDGCEEYGRQEDEYQRCLSRKK